MMVFKVFSEPEPPPLISPLTLPLNHPVPYWPPCCLLTHTQHTLSPEMALASPSFWKIPPPPQIS